MERSIDVNGIEVFVEGEGQECILMLHGWPDTHRLWDGQVKGLRDSYTCIRFTLPGYLVEQDRRAWTLDEMNALIRDVLDQVCEGRPVILLLHDWGCMYGYQFYSEFPQYVSKIIGVDIGDWVSTKEQAGLYQSTVAYSYQAVLAAMWKVGGRIGDCVTRGMAKLFQHPLPLDHVHSGMNYPYAMFRYAGNKSYTKLLKAFEPECPFLYIYGTKKPIMFHDDAWMERMAQKDGNGVIAFDTNHWVMIEKTERFNRTIREWLFTERANAS